MMNRNYIILLVFTLFSALATGYLVTVLDPFDREALEGLMEETQISSTQQLIDEWEDLKARGLLWSYINKSNLLVITVSGLIAVSCGSLLIQLVATRLSKNPNTNYRITLSKMRRSTLLALGILFTMVYRLLAADWYIILLTWLLIIITELLIVKAFTAEPKDQNMQHEAGSISAVLKSRHE